MPVDLPEVHAQALDSARRSIAGIGPDQWELPSTCEGWSVRELVNHLTTGNHWAAELTAGRTVAVLADLPGPKIRAGEFPDGGEFLAEGMTLRLVPGDGPSHDDVVTVEYDALLDDLHPGDRVVLGDGAIELSVLDVDENGVSTRVVTGGRAQGRPGVHLPSERMRVSCPTPLDLELAARIRGTDVDYLAVSFVRSASDLDVEKRNWMLIDIDPQRPSGVSATDAEKEQARRVSLDICSHLTDRGWPQPIWVDSGNGYHLLYGVDLPRDDGGRIRTILALLAERFDTAAVKVDRSVHNPARICKLPGTLARKGAHTPDRPHRRAKILEGPSS